MITTTQTPPRSLEAEWERDKAGGVTDADFPDYKHAREELDRIYEACHNTSDRDTINRLEREARIHERVVGA